MDRCVDQELVIQQWAQAQPKLTIFHLGACDIANTPLGKSDNIRQPMRDKVDKFLDNFIKKGRDSANDKASFDTFVKERHQFLFIMVPDWGPFEKKYDWSLDAETFAKQRSDANQALKSMSKTLWQRYNLVLFTPQLERALRNPGDVHPKGRSNTQYCDQILQVAAKLCCTDCSALSKTFDKEQHKHDALLAQVCAGRTA